MSDIRRALEVIERHRQRILRPGIRPGDGTLEWILEVLDAIVCDLKADQR